MGSRKLADGYPVRGRGKTDLYQSWVESLNRDAVLNVIEKEPGLNLSQIAQRLPAMREKLLAQEIERQSRLPTALRESMPKVKRKLPKRGDARKTARKHAYNMLSMGRIKKIGAGYYSASRESRVSTELIKSVNELLTHESSSDWSFPVAHNAAMYRVVVDPPRYHDQLADLLNSQIPHFTRGPFFLDSIIEAAIGNGFMSTRVYDPNKKSIDLVLLRKGWDSYFRDTRLILFAFAIDPSKLLQFVESPIGREHSEKMLTNYWSSIMKRADEKLRLRARLETLPRRNEADNTS